MATVRIRQSVAVSDVALADFCERWKIVEMSLFGSALRGDFTPDSDIDVLVVFNEQADWGLLDHVNMEQELAALLGRSVDLVSRRTIERSRNQIRHEHILGTTQLMFRASEV